MLCVLKKEINTNETKSLLFEVKVLMFTLKNYHFFHFHFHLMTIRDITKDFAVLILQIDNVNIQNKFTDFVSQTC